MAQELSDLVRRLEDYSSRSDAMRELQRIGSPAVPALIEALDSPFQPVRWAAIRVLGHIGDPAAIEKLQQLRGDPLLGAAAAEALAAVAHRSPAGAARIEEEEEEFMERLTTGADMTWRKGENHYVLTVPTTGGRTQEVRLFFTERDAEGVAALAIYSQCGPAHPKHYEWALQQNMRLKLGALAIRKVEREARFVMIDKYPRPSICVEAIREAIAEVARKADAIEKALTRRDIY